MTSSHFKRIYLSVFFAAIIALAAFGFTAQQSLFAQGQPQEQTQELEQEQQEEAATEATADTPTNDETANNKILDIRELKTPAGITVWLMEDHSIPVISVEFAFKGAGSLNETPETQGLVRMLSNTMDEGAGDLDSEAFQKELRDLSISLSFSSSRDSFSGSLYTLKDNNARAFSLLKMALHEPRFDEEPVNRMRASNQARIRSSLTDPNWLAARLLNDVSYPDHVYALNAGGTLSTLNAITPDMLREFAKTQLTRDRLFVSVAGAISVEDITAIIDDIFAELPASAPEIDIPMINIGNPSAIFLHKHDIPQTIIQIQQNGISRTNPNFFHAQIMNFILGSSGFGSRLTEEIREKRGLTYGIHSFFSHNDYANGLNISTSTENSNVEEMLRLIQAEFEKLRSYPPTQEELDNAKSYLIGSTPLAFTSTSAIAGLMLTLQLDGLGADYLDRRVQAIQSATLEDIFRISQRVLRPENFVTVLVGNPSSLPPSAQIVETLPNVE
ncbi:MAG: M16 family metallopeptidase [Alphaproteobacteria bacterium]